MNRLLYSCLLLLSLFFVKTVNAQAFHFSITPTSVCFDGVNPVVGQAAVTSPGAAAASFSWIITPPAGCPAATYTVDPTAPTGSLINVTYNCCGNYSIQGTSYAPNSASLQTEFHYPAIFCTNSATITQTGTTNSYVCQGQTATLTASGASTYTWSNGVINSSIAVTPTADQCYTVTGTAPAGCTMQAVSCVSVQITTLTLSPSSQTTCAGNTATINATASSNTTGIQWYSPPGGQPTTGGTALSQTISAGPPTGPYTYTAVATSNGPAGSCTVGATSTLVIGTSISMTVNASASVCPNAAHNLTVVPTGATTYTLVSSNAVTTPSFTSTSNILPVDGPATYTVHGDYQGCPGSAQVTVLTATLTPTLTATNLNNNLSCPGNSISLLAAGGSTYTFVRPSATFPFTTTIGTPSSTTNSAVATPTSLGSGITYTVFAGQGGCTGSATLTVHQVTLHPHLTPNLSAVCPGSTFSLTASGALNYTFTSPAGLSTTTITANTATASIPTGSFPATYTLVSDSAGCKNNTVTTINLRVITPTVSLSSPSVCPNTPFTFTVQPGGTTNYTFTPPASVTITSAANQATSTVPSATMFPATYTIHADSSGCVGVTTKTIGLLSLNNNITLVATPSLVCPGNQFTLAAAHADSYTFTAPPTLTVGVYSVKGDSATSSIPLSFVPSSYIYTVSADSAGCVGTRTTMVQQLFIQPTLSITPSGSVCAGSHVTLTASSNNTNAPTSYTFISTPPTTVLATGQSYTATHSPTAFTTYSVYADSSGCINLPANPGTATIGILPNLSLTLTASTPTVCSGEQSTLSVNSVPNYSYTWLSSPSGTLNNPNDTTAIVNPTTNTTYTVHAIDPGGCVGDATITININPTASLAITAAASPTAVCPNQQSTLTASSTSGLSYTWTPSSTVSPPTSATTVASPTANTIYTITTTNNLGCFGATTVGVNVVALPNVTIVPSTQSVCPGYNATLTAYGALSYTWNGATTNTLTGTTTITPVYQQSIAVVAGIYTVVGSNGGSCISSPTVMNIAQGQPLNIQVSASTPNNTTCITNNNPKYSKPVVLTASGGSSYSWLPYNPTVMTYSLGAQTTVIPPASTCYTVVGYTSVCSGTGQVCVTVIPQFTMNVVPPLPAMCVGDSLHLNIVNIATTAVGPASAFTYSWTEPGNQALTLSDDFSPSVVAWPNATSTYSVEMRDARDCVSLPRLVTVTVYPRPITAISIPTINSVPTNTVCYVGLNPGEGDNLLTLTASNANTGLPFGVVPTYTWLAPSPYVPNYNSILTPANNNVVTVNAPLRAPAVVVYTVVSGYNGIPGCARYDTVSVRVVDCRPITVSKIKFITDNDGGDTLCTRQCVTFTSLTDTAAGGPQKLLWLFPGGNPAQSTDLNPTVCYNLPNSSGYNVILKVDNPYPTSTGGSSATRGLPRFVKVFDYPSVSIISPAGIRSDTTVRFGQSVSLSGSGALSYEWYPPYNISSLTNPKVIVNPFQTTEYILTGYNSKKCYSSDTINVIVIPDCGEMFVPNAFSPNGDDHNDVLYVRGICLQTLTFMVFNRWGEKVFETFDQSVGWDGTYRGEPLNTGVFVYRLEGKTYDGKGFSSKGNVTLIR